MNQNKLKILVSDQDLDFLKVAEEKLSERGFKVLTTTSANQTIEILKTVYVDSILLNMNDANERVMVLNFIQTLKKKPKVLGAAQGESDISMVTTF